MGTVPPMRFLDPGPDPSCRNSAAARPRAWLDSRNRTLGYGGVSHVPAAQAQARHA